MTSLPHHSNRLPVHSRLNAVTSASQDVYAYADTGDGGVESKLCWMFEFKKGLNFSQGESVSLRIPDRA